ncbi:MAG: LD-carboxypeptidase [Flavobacteriales bacterium]|nr:LD-carboxypeptidase [Flavobacteriales bacterium]
MIAPKTLNIGDQIAIVSTARAIQKDHLTYATSLLESWGLNVVVGEHLEAVCHQFAGTDIERAADLQAAISNPEIRAILCFRGGYGTVRVMDLVDFSPLLYDPKWICGYSDITVLHHQLNRIGVESIHSTMPVNFENNSKAALSTLKSALFGETYAIQSEVHPKNRFGTAKGELVGGNLSILYSLGGTDLDLETNGKILFIEDLDEYLYHLDRMMINLKRSGKLNGLKGLIVGGMTDMNDNAIPFGKNALEIIEDAVSSYSYPVAYQFPVGHQKDNQSLILGSSVDFHVNDSGIRLEFNRVH